MPTTSLDFDNSWKKMAEKTKSEESAVSTCVSAGQVRECLRLGVSRWRAADHLELILQRSLLLLAVFPVPLLLSFPFWFFHTFFPLYLSYLMQKKKPCTFSLHLTKIINTSEIWGKSHLRQNRKNSKDSIHKTNRKIKQNQISANYHWICKYRLQGAGENCSELLYFYN